ncbi:MAG: ABC transporter ATP-binding protein [Deltaproteobacteria bacterium]|nr:ABC transporter ATP-binding protein [Deltaproteobacteria bacterium]
MSKILKVSHLKKSYLKSNLELHVLNGIDLEVHAGTWTTLLGSSGSGKSTLLHLIAGLDRPSSGEIFFAGQKIHCAHAKALARYRGEDVGIIFQFFNLFSALSVEENLMLPLMLKKQKYHESQIEIIELLDLLEMRPLLNRRVQDLSGGERQRVALCRTLLAKPKLLLADEPTGSLDQKSGESVIALLQYAWKKFQTTVLMVTHDKNLSQFADRVLYMKDGRLIS